MDETANINAGHGGASASTNVSPSVDAVTQPAQPTLFVECTHTFHSSMNTGIQRVVRNVLRHASDGAAPHGYAVVPVVFNNRRFVEVDPTRLLAGNPADMMRGPEEPPPPTDGVRRLWRGLLNGLARMLPGAAPRRFLFASPDEFGAAWCVLLPVRLLGLRPWHTPAAPGTVTLDRFERLDHSILLLLDSSWNYPIWPAVKRFRQRGGSVVGVICDVIPVTHPHTAVPELTVAFDHWLREHIRHTHAFLGISRSTADLLRDYVRTISHSEPTIDHFLLGSELDLVAADTVRGELADIFTQDHHVFLMVGSIEPRKNHGYVLDAFDEFWARGGRASLVIIGRYGWKNEIVIDRIARHPQRDRQLFLVRDGSDSDLDHAYRTASALVIASEIEGFGLPVVEAFQRGLPVLCSDIPVFREIAEGAATFFDLSDPRNLTEVLEIFCRDNDPRQRPRHPRPWITWRESTDLLFDAVLRVLGRGAEPVAKA
jgi:alpha-1,2-rhamnosyltransferase